MGEPVSVPTDDLRYAHQLVDRLDAEKMTKAIYALEDIIEGAVYVTPMSEDDEMIDDAESQAAARGRRDLEQGRVFTMEEVLKELNLSASDLATPSSTNQDKDSRAA